MDEKGIKNQYLNSVKNEIKWKKARDAAVTEISDHIDDLYDSYIATGTSPDDAMNKAVEKIGSPELVGSMLNKTYRPVLNFEVIIMLAAFAVFGCFVHGFYSGYSSIIGIVIGAAATACFYWIDYEKLARKMPILYAGFAILAAAAFVFDELLAPARMAGTNRWGYVLMLSPFLHAGLVYYLKNKKNRMDILIFWGTLIIPLTILAVSENASFALILLVMDVFEVILLLKMEPDFLKKMCRNKAANGIVTAATAAVSFLSVKYIVLNLSMNTGEQNFIENAWQTMQFTGKNLSDGVMNNAGITKTAFPLLYLSGRYGLMSVCVMLFFYALLAVVLVRVIVRQKSKLGAQLVLTISVLYTTQLLVALLCNFGIIGTSLYISFPFFGGTVMTFIDYALLGVILSISRYQNIKSGEHFVYD